jgi:hypothetical protein
MSTPQDQPGFYLVEVTETWSASCEVLVAAPSREIAERVAEQEIDFCSLDAESDDKSADVRQVLTIADLEVLRAGGHDIDSTAYVAKAYSVRLGDQVRFGWEGDDLPLEEFLERFADPDAVAAYRLAERERNNGQLPLIPEAAL